jgi:hypothetical protein
MFQIEQVDGDICKYGKLKVKTLLSFIFSSWWLSK